MNDRPSGRILTAVAEAEGTDPLDLPPLAETVDPDALDRLMDSSEWMTISFRYAGYLVSIRSEHDVHVTVESLAHLA